MMNEERIHLEYNGEILPDNCVPNCKISLCEEKATAPCERCEDPICNGHVSLAVEGHVCQTCRFVEWQSICSSKG